MILSGGFGLLVLVWSYLCVCYGGTTTVPRATTLLYVYMLAVEGRAYFDAEAV